MLATHNEYESWHYESKAEGGNSTGQLNIENMKEESHNKDDKAIAYLYDNLREDLVDEDVANHQVKTQHYPNVKYTWEVLFRQHPKCSVVLVERQLTPSEEISEPDEVEPDEEV